MENDLPTREKFKELALDQSFKSLLNLLIENKFQDSCFKINQKLDFFESAGFQKIKHNSAYICFDNLKSMYSDNVIPENVFWITCVNTNNDDSFIQPHIFIQQLNLITQQIKINAFNLTHEWYFEHEGNSGIFLHFLKPVNNIHHFISIFVAYKNIDDEPTLTEVKNEKK